MNNQQSTTRATQRTIMISKKTTSEIVSKLMQFRETLERTAMQEGTDLFSLYLGVGYVLLDVCEILGLSADETQVVMGEATAETVKTCYHD